MRKVWQLVVAAGVSFALALAVGGCGSSTPAAKNEGKMETGKMDGEKGKMATDKMNGEKGKMATDKMNGEKGKMDGDKGKM